MKHKRLLFFIISVISCAACAETTNDKPLPTELVADNGTLTVKFDLTRGGAISWISLSGSEHSLVNIADEGR